MKASMCRLLVAVAAVAALAVMSTGAALAEQSYPDGTGDAGAGTDISSITVRNDQSGAVSIQVGVVNPIVDNHGLIVFIDADKNQSTGGDGDEFIMLGGPLIGSVFLAWNGSGFVPASPPGFARG